MAGKRVVIEFLGKDKSLGKTADGLGGKADRLGGRLKKFGLVAAAGFSLAGLAAGKFAKDSIAEARESQKVGALTTQVIKSTGGAAKVTAGEVGRLATAISNKAGMDDEAIQTGANLLLTFKNIRNEAGKGNKIFNQATQAAVDLSAAGFGSVDSAAKQLGKALNDPLKGITALGRSGVTFSESQKKLIKGFVEQGDMLSAQKIILGEVKSQVGGAAAASATAGEKLAVSWGNFKEAIGTALLPLVDKLAVLIGGRLLPAVIRMGPAFQRLAGGIKAVSDILFKGDFTGRFREIFGAGEDSKSVDTLFKIREAVIGLIAKVRANLPQIRATFASVFADVKSIVASAVSIIQSLWSKFGSTITAFLAGTFANLLTIVRGGFTVIRGIFQTVAALLRGDWKGVWDGIKTILRGAWTVIRGLVAQGWNLIKTIFRASGIAIKAIFKGVWSATLSLARAGINALVSAFRSIPGRLKALGGLMKSAGKGVLTALLNGLKGAGGFASSFANKIWTAIKDAINGGIDRLNDLLDFSIKVGPKKFHVSAPNIGHLAKGTDNWRGGPTWVGERGPEILDLPKGSRVTPNHKIGGGESQRPLVVQLVVDGKVLAQSLVKYENDKGSPIGLRLA